MDHRGSIDRTMKTLHLAPKDSANRIKFLVLYFDKENKRWKCEAMFGHQMQLFKHGSHGINMEKVLQDFREMDKVEMALYELAKNAASKK